MQQVGNHIRLQSADIPRPTARGIGAAPAARAGAVGGRSTQASIVGLQSTQARRHRRRSSPPHANRSAPHHCGSNHTCGRTGCNQNRVRHTSPFIIATTRRRLASRRAGLATARSRTQRNWVGTELFSMNQVRGLSVGNRHPLLKPVLSHAPSFRIVHQLDHTPDCLPHFMLKSFPFGLQQPHQVLADLVF